MLLLYPVIPASEQYIEPMISGCTDIMRIESNHSATDLITLHMQHCLYY